MVRNITYEFLFICHSNRGPILHRFLDTASLTKIASFCSKPLLVVSLWNWNVSSVLFARNYNELSGSERIYMLRLVVWCGHKYRDGRTEGQKYYTNIALRIALPREGATKMTKIQLDGLLEYVN